MSQFHIVLFPKLQIDTVISYFLLKAYGEKKIPGIKDAPIEFWTELPADKTADELEQEGYILIDLGNGRFDHHRLGENNKKISASHLIAQYLEIQDQPEIQKMLEFARRDDLEGKGTISNDSIDRAFGLPGLLASLNKSFGTKPHQVLNTVLPLIEAHHLQELQRYEHMPKLLDEGLKTGTIKIFNAIQFGRQLKVIYIESDNHGMASFLRSKDVGADMVIQKAPTGHVNFITKQALKLQLHKLARQIKMLEAEKNNVVFNIDSMEELERAGRTEGLPHWYYDTRANTLQNGGINPQNIPPTSLTYADIELAVKQSLNIPRTQDKFHNNNNKNFRSRDGFRRHNGAIIID